MDARIEDVGETSARLLRLLSLLQARPHWSGPELAERLGVTDRTVRRDVDRLRTLGYPVDAAPGPDGGYQLGPGGTLPPLLLDDDEAIAVAVALGATAGGAVEGVEESAVAALAKLDRLLPPALRHQVEAIRAATVRLGVATDDVPPARLATLATAIAGTERCAIDYRDREGRDTERRIDPFRLVSTGRRWYLVALDVDRGEWRTLRVDRIRAARRTGHRFQLVDPPDAADLVSRAMGVAPYRFQLRALIDAPAADVRARVPATVGVVHARGRDRCELAVGADDLPSIAGHLVAMDLPFEVLEPQAVRDHLAAVGERLVARHHG
jgi:predicted DNA-binding transcriptional regulator YafY